MLWGSGMSWRPFSRKLPSIPMSKSQFRHKACRQHLYIWCHFCHLKAQRSLSILWILISISIQHCCLFFFLLSFWGNLRTQELFTPQEQGTEQDTYHENFRSECPVYAGTQIPMTQRILIHMRGVQDQGRSVVDRCVTVAFSYWFTHDPAESKHNSHTVNHRNESQQSASDVHRK